MPYVDFQWFYKQGLYARWRYAVLNSAQPADVFRKIESRVNCHWTTNSRTIWLKDPTEFPKIEEFLERELKTFFDAAEENCEHQEVTKRQYYRNGHYARWYVYFVNQTYFEIELRRILYGFCEGKFHIGSAGVVAFERHEDFFQASLML